jgi:hypothetical protein
VTKSLAAAVVARYWTFLLDSGELAETPPFPIPDIALNPTQPFSDDSNRSYIIRKTAVLW